MAMNLYTVDQCATMWQHQWEYLLVSQHGTVLHISLNRPQKKNALHPQMVNELAYALHYAHYSPEVWLVRLSAQGDVFCAGADLRALVAGDTQAGISTIPAPASEVLLADLFKGLLKPCVAQVQGDVLAGGHLLICGCTQVVAADGVQFSLPEIRRGLFPFQVMAALTEAMPARRVLDWCLRGHSLSAGEALHWGLVTEVCPPEQLAQRTDRIVEELLRGSPTAMRLGIEAYHQFRSYSSSEQHTYLMGMLWRAFQSADGQEGVAAFAQKRPPVWTGR